MNGERGRSVSTGVIAAVLIAIVALSIFFQNLDIFFPQLLEPDPQTPPPVVLELPSFLDGCLRNEENTLTIYEEDGIVHGDQFYQCEINELSEADEILKKQGLASINSQEIHFSMSSTGILEFFTPMHLGFWSMVASRPGFSATPASWGML